MHRLCFFSMVAGLTGSLLLCTPAPLPAADPLGPKADDWNKVVDKAFAFLKSQQADDGSWSKDKSLGISGIVMTGLLSTGRIDSKDEMAAKGLKFLETLINEKEGHIAGANPKDQLKNYVTSVNVMAFAFANKDGKYDKVLKSGAKYLRELQWDDGEKKDKSSDFFGGAGYDSKSRPDLSNTQFFIDALKSAGVPQDDEAFKKAVIFVSRCQNFKSEFNDQPWAGKINDGSFIYSAAGGGETKADVTAEGGLSGYGSITYAGIKSLVYAGVGKDDKRVKAAIDWARKNYTLDENPGMPKARNQQALYYYYHTMAKCLDALGIDTFEDAKGVKHDWRKEIFEALMSRQQKDGSWVNEADRWMEGDPNLVTAYALMTLSYCKPKK